MPRRTTAPGAVQREELNTRELIGRRIAQRRATLGMSQAELALLFGVSRAALSQCEIGAADLNAGDMLYLAEILGVPITYFFVPEMSQDDRHLRNLITHASSRLSLLPEREQSFIMGIIDLSHSRLNQEVNFPARKTKRRQGEALKEKVTT